MRLLLTQGRGTAGKTDRTASFLFFRVPRVRSQRQSRMRDWRLRTTPTGPARTRSGPMRAVPAPSRQSGHKDASPGARLAATREGQSSGRWTRISEPGRVAGRAASMPVEVDVDAATAAALDAARCTPSPQRLGPPLAHGQAGSAWAAAWPAVDGAAPLRGQCVGDQ